MLSIVLAALFATGEYRPWILMAARQNGPYLVWTEARYRNRQECNEAAFYTVQHLPVAAIYCTTDPPQT